MAAQHRQQPSRLFIPPMLNSQLANSVDTRTMFSPALQTAHQPGFPPLPSAHPFNPGFPLQTPVQPSFFPPNAPPRQIGHGHRPSIAHVPSMGMQPPIPMTPFGSQFPPQMLHGGGQPNPSAQPFVPKSRRTPSMIGGPPKAPLGGPNRKVSPLPPSSQVAAIAEKVKARKIPVKIPVESERDEEDVDGSKRSLWSRKPISPSDLETPADLDPPEIFTAVSYPDDEYRKHLPPTVDVFLPSRAAWDEMKQREIDEKLEKLGIERRAESGHPDALHTRGRAASISSPADPALLTFKLNMLQKQQSASNSISTSPQPHTASVSPNPLLLSRLQTHGHSMSLSQPSALPLHVPNGKVAVKSDSPVSQDGGPQVSSPLGIYAPQGRIPAQLYVPSAPSRAEDRPDFIRGFGLDIPEEEEEEEEAQDAGTEHAADRTITDQPNGLEDNAPPSDAVQSGNVQSNVAAKEGTHTRHVSRISVALSIGSMSKNLEETMVGHSRHSSLAAPVQSVEHKSESTADALNEWTGSESDLSDDQESIGEWSNPSDEERARQERLQRRYLRRMNREAQEAPRRLPEFPKPPQDRYITRNDDEDVISNPSDEGRHMAFNNHAIDGFHYPHPVGDPNARASRPLPAVPHSRDPSNQYSYYGSLRSQSPDRFTSGQLSLPVSRPASTRHTKTPSLSSSKKELNPFAKPFVFVGRAPLAPAAAAPASVPTSTQSEAGSSLAQSTIPTHFRTPSFGTTRKLNVAAQEFKPGAFTFRLPEGVPKLSFPEPAPESSRPLPEPPTTGITRAVQGREKRQRTSLSDASYDSYDSEGERANDSMASFRFPPAPESTMVFTRSAPTSPSPAVTRTATTLNTSTKPGTFSGFSNLPPTLPPLLGQEGSSPDGLSIADFPSMNATRGSALGDDQQSPGVTLPNMQRQKRAPIPLDFKHPVSTNMVPAGLFKNLGTGDAEGARNGRTHSGSLDFPESRSDVSLDDLSMPAISRKATKRMPKPEDLDVSEDEFEGASNASNDGVSHSDQTQATRPESLASRSSMLPPDVASYSQGLRLEERIESFLDHKIDVLRSDLLAQLKGSGFISSSTDELVREAMAMFRTQLRDSAVKSLDDNSMEARGELDFELIRGIIEQGQEDIRKNIQDDLAMILKNIRDTEGTTTPESILDLIRSVQELRANVLASSAHVAERLDAIEAGAPYRGVQLDREGLIIDILSGMTPHLAAIRSEPVDYEGLTAQLSQAVKPHISQLIDLASDKRETAGLIVEQLMPVLQSFASEPREFDTGDLVAEVSATINRIIAPIDTHAIKEQVADLVVERLDSRLATRDNDVAINFENLKNKITEAISPLLGQLSSVGDGVESLSSVQSSMSHVARESSSKQADALREVAALSEQLGRLAEILASVQSLVSKQNEDSNTRNQVLSRIETSINTKVISGIGLSNEEREEILSANREVLARLNPISDSITSALSTAGEKHGEVLSRLQSMDDSSQEMRKLNAQNSELQNQLNRARSQHGQIRVQHEELASKVVLAEEERDQLRTKVEELNAAALAHVAEFAALEARNCEQERAMHVALERLKISDINAQTFQERIAELEKANREMTQENQQLKLKINRLEMQAEFAAKDKESMSQALKLMQEDRDRLAAQQSHWEEFRDAAEQIENLANLMRNSESEEMAGLRRIRDQSKILEGEHEALKRRFKEQESKFANVERSSATARQNLAQAQQRSTEWERKAREFEGEVESLTTALDQAEQTKNQLDADYSLAKLQLEEREAEDRIVKDRERKLEEQVAALKSQMSSLSSELEKERRTSQWRRSREQQERGRSRPISTEYQPSEPPTPRINGKSLPNASARSSAVVSPQPNSSTWDSMHAPKVIPSTYGNVHPALTRTQGSIYNSRAASPTPSVVSTVTRGEDGWFS
ncbi:hypothetical protein A7U60_g3612 [Sanghuangporus baumii]|uniref:Uncharacterized protein n=1 Tax=Sanghuangporus baumii TaxID=108892 RepID=A0A9Q5I051_SANBA|nr:hypothetical protein A7U60_g3612 [Sanghuangporus baumii]